MVFIDLVGSTAAYASLGNAQVADVIARVTQWIGRVCEAHHGRIIKVLGDGVMAGFAEAGNAVEAATFLQQSHSERLQKWPAPLRMALKIGMARGAVVERGDDVYGDPVNLAARLSDMAGGHAIWADEGVIAALREARANRAGGEGQDSRMPTGMARYRSLGLIRVRGLEQPQSVFQIEWNEDVSTDLMTVQGVLQVQEPPSTGARGNIALAWLGNVSVFSADQLPIVIGRVPDCSFVVSDQRVSRNHARIELDNGALVLSDLSSFGTWVRFTENLQAEVQLRRNQCVLHSTGEISLGAPFSDFSAAIVAFHVGADVNSAAEKTQPLFDEAGRA